MPSTNFFLMLPIIVAMSVLGPNNTIAISQDDGSYCAPLESGLLEYCMVYPGKVIQCHGNETKQELCEQIMDKLK